MINIDGIQTDRVKEVLNDCSDGNEWELASNIKVAVQTVHDTPPGASPYFVCCGNLQTINDSTDFSVRILRNFRMKLQHLMEIQFY
jgi:hypothetical protein